MAINPPDPWPAPLASRPVTACIDVPGSKSQTNRALVLAALADDPSHLIGALDARDTALMITALTNLGAIITTQPGRVSGTLDCHVMPLVDPGSQQRVDAVMIDVGLAGTVMRFLPPVAALTQATVIFDGDSRSRERPLGPMLTAMRDLGIDVTDDHGFLPAQVTGVGGVRGGDVRIDASASSQFVSGLLLSGARFDEGLNLTHIGAHLPSQPHIEMTIAMLGEHNVTVHRSGSPEHPTWHVAPGPISAVDRVIEPDLSNAAPFLVAALVTGGRMRIPDWPAHTTQAGDQLRELLTHMGARIERDGDALVLIGPDEVRGITVNLHEVGELAPVLAAAAALATSPSHLTGIGHLRGHETDRLAALAELIGTLGGEVECGDDDLLITPRPLHGGVVSSYGDHRMATAAAVLGLRTPGVLIGDVATTTKTLPDFPGMWHHMLEQRA
jgi:3-phosphoshikimate 1-carboxyvinyltransferase